MTTLKQLIKNVQDSITVPQDGWGHDYAEGERAGLHMAFKVYTECKQDTEATREKLNRIMVARMGRHEDSASFLGVTSGVAMGLALTYQLSE